MILSINNRLRVGILGFVVMGAAVAIAACGGDSEVSESDAVSVVTTTYPITYFTERVGGDNVNITQMIKPGVESHDFEPAPSDIRLVGDADIFLFNSEEFEGWAQDLAESADSDDLRIVAVADLEGHQKPEEDHSEHEEDEHAGHDEHEHADSEEDEHAEGEDPGEQEHVDGHDHEHGEDPHVWLNPVEAIDMVENIRDALIELDPDSSDQYTQRASALTSELLDLDSEIGSSLNGCSQTTAVVSHLAYGHMAERYGFEQVGLAGLSAEFESGPGQIAAVVDHINEDGITAILQEPIVSDRLAQTVADETGAHLLTLHPLEVRTLEEADAGRTYFDIMTKNAEALSVALQCDSAS